jgi:hypothetical protein
MGAHQEADAFHQLSLTLGLGQCLDILGQLAALLE